MANRDRVRTANRPTKNAYLPLGQSLDGRLSEGKTISHCGHTVRTDLYFSSKRIDELDKRLGQIEELLRDAVNPLKQAGQQITPAAKEETSPRTHDSSNLNGTGAATFMLPPLSEGLQLADQYFNTMNRFLPLFNEKDLIQSMQQQYECLETGNPALWAAVNVIFALAHQLSAQKVVPDGIDHQLQAIGFVKNAMSVVGQLSTREPNPLCLRVLLGIAKVWQSTPTPQTATMYLAMAVRQIFHLNLHRGIQQDDRSEEQLEWDKRLFWYAYSLDKDFSLRLDQPHDLKGKFE